MATESHLYTISQPTKDALRKFRLGTSRAKDAQAIVYIIDKKTLEIRTEDDEVYTTLDDLADALPDNSPRFVLLSYPMTMPSGRLAVPYVMLSYTPPTCNNEQRMLYAGARELFRREAETSRVLELGDTDDLAEVPARLGGED